MTADAMVTQGARASAGVISTKQDMFWTSRGSFKIKMASYLCTSIGIPIVQVSQFITVSFTRPGGKMSHCLVNRNPRKKVFIVKYCLCVWPGESCF